MRRKIAIALNDKTVTTTEVDGLDVVHAGRYQTSRTLLENGIAKVDPMSPDNLLIFSAGPFAGTNFSNANRLSVGCKSPLTGGIKEANAGGTFAFAMGQLQICEITFTNAFDDWTLIYIPKEGPIEFHDASEYLGLGNFDCAKALHQRFGDKTSLGICGPIGEYLGLMAGIAFSDDENRPTRFAARGGVGAVMGSKKIKAIIIDRNKMPPFHERKKVMLAVREYGKLLDESVPVQALKTTGTAMVADLTNHLGALPVNNFSSGQLTNAETGPLKMGGDFIRERNLSRRGEISHACMPGCQIKCSNVYVDKDGKEMVSPLEYETLGLLGTNCGLTEPDDLALLNAVANDLGIDSIELGTTIGVLMEAGEADFGDVEFMRQCLRDIRSGNERGKFLSQGTARVGQELGVARVPVIKQQAISAYDPRVIEVTGISMMLTAQGADHTTGNEPSFKCDDKTVEQLVGESFKVQIASAVSDSLGLCVFGRSVTNVHYDMLARAINDAHGTHITAADIRTIGLETLKTEAAFNKQAGFTDEDDELPNFFTTQPLPPTGKIGRLKSAEVNEYFNDLLAAEN